MGISGIGPTKEGGLDAPALQARKWPTSPSLVREGLPMPRSCLIRDRDHLDRHSEHGHGLVIHNRDQALQGALG